jgi:ABC-type bacteriocin/lantibiotic exporter with double-glycine peptidase domain
MRLVRLVRPHWRALGKGMALGPVVGILGMVPPYLTKLLIDEVYSSQDANLMHVIVGGLLAVSVTSAFLQALQGVSPITVQHCTHNADHQRGDSTGHS